MIILHTETTETTKFYSEDQVEAYLIKRCKKLKIFHLKNTGMNAIPDRLCIYKGVHLFVELKKTGGTLRPDQKARARELERYGAEVTMADSYESVEKVLQYLIKKGDENENRQSKRKTRKT